MHAAGLVAAGENEQVRAPLVEPPARRGPPRRVATDPAGAARQMLDQLRL